MSGRPPTTRVTQSSDTSRADLRLHIGPGIWLRLNAVQCVSVGLGTSPKPRKPTLSQAFRPDHPTGDRGIEPRARVLETPTHQSIRPVNSGFGVSLVPLEYQFWSRNSPPR